MHICILYLLMHIPYTFEDLLVNDSEDLEVQDVEPTQAHKLIPLVHLIGLTCKIKPRVCITQLERILDHEHCYPINKKRG